MTPAATNAHPLIMLIARRCGSARESRACIMSKIPTLAHRLMSVPPPPHKSLPQCLTASAAPAHVKLFPASLPLLTTARCVGQLCSVSEANHT